MIKIIILDWDRVFLKIKKIKQIITICFTRISKCPSLVWVRAIVQIRPNGEESIVECLSRGITQTRANWWGNKLSE